MVKKIFSLLTVGVLLSSLLMVNVSAYNTESVLRLAYGSNMITTSDTQKSVVETTPLTNYEYTVGTSSNKYALDSFYTTEEYFPAVTGMYMSYYWDSNSISGTWTLSSPYYSTDNYTVSYVNQAGVIGTASTLEIEQFSPAEDTTVVSPGITLKAEFVGSPELPIKNLKVTNKTGSADGYSNTYLANASFSSSVKASLVVSSFSVVEVKSLTELDWLESVANEITAQSDILSAMYGDVMEVLNAIYQRTGDMLEAQQLANSYFSNILNYIKHIDTLTLNIYNLLGAQFDLLISTINVASGDIVDAIEQQTEDMQAYFDSVFQESIGTLPEDVESTQDTIDQADEYEEDYKSDASGKFTELAAAFNGFNGDVGSGVALASTLFSQVWGALGDYVIVYTFPLLLGLALVIVGRLSRVHVRSSGGRETKKPGDDE